MKAPITLKQLAQSLGLSASTVSKALNNRPDISAATRDRVVSAAKRLHYRPDPAGQRLRRQSSDAIGFVLSAPQSRFANPFFLDMLTGINEELEGSRFQVIITSARSPEHELQCFRWLVEEQRVDGLIFGRTRRDDPRIDYLARRGTPFVTLGRSETRRSFSFLDIDHTVVGHDGCARFVALGHRRIALLNTPDDLMISHHHAIGYRKALKAASIAAAPELMVCGDITEEGGVAATRRLLDLKNPPTAIVCGNDLMAIGAMRAIAERRLRPGVDIGVIGGDNHPIGSMIEPPLTTFSAETHAAGRRMVQMLLAVISGTAPSELQELWLPELIVRSSDGPRRREVSAQRGSVKRSRQTSRNAPTSPPRND